MPIGAGLHCSLRHPDEWIRIPSVGGETLASAKLLDLLEEIRFCAVGVGLHVVDDHADRLVHGNTDRARHGRIERATHRHDDELN